MNSSINFVLHIQKQFLCCTPLNKFSWTDELESIDEYYQSQIMDATVNYNLVLKYPIKKSYQIAFLKLFMEKLASYGVEIIGEIYHKYCVMISTKNQEFPFHYRHFIYDDLRLTNYCLTIKESTNIISQGTTGLCSWQASLGLIEWCFANAEELRGKSILELGSGVGLSGLAVIKRCSPSKYVFSDCHVAVLNLLSDNINLNLSSIDEEYSQIQNLSDRCFLRAKYRNIQVEAIDLNWSEVDEYINDEKNMKPDIVMAADVLYDSSNFQDLARSLRSLLQNGSLYAVIAATIRNEETITTFLKELACHNLIYEEDVKPVPEVFIKSEDAPIKVYKILMKNR